MELAEMYSKVLAAMRAAEVPEDLREAGFVTGLEIVARDTNERDVQAGSSRVQPSQRNGVDNEDPVDRIASRFGVDPEVVSEVFHDDDGQLGIGVAPSRLAKGAASGTKQIALLLAAGRQAGGYDDAYTPVSLIRERCRDFARLDSGNFSTTITEMKDEFTFKGKGQARMVHVTRPGWAKAKALILELTNGS